ncbi:phosphoribosylaminoimidazolesuccinocarboxamide synthase [Granulicatella sp. 19428wC4_WM01]|uniref:phosphoribosylaminoimidazolesuccinocarboxamide synthase n=1 Tax=unclassified Granulicatella TaxID=2630493 RepID=UPI001073BE77|nr:phosphoribosylaminoimidazolesuccinocarboxamide synthase [Granulicatella sp. 19428wC4_WM01]MBF0779780.1 phosphoribosylaminoimidazolesuccinocarboxamide synthase [Granulicatella sp. 19428wC4_WM01]TFU96182.1 phosphoribosylaminoimidazolesuccinocarboxamide synthase [Granulicatella sp. WM01]
MKLLYEGKAKQLFEVENEQEIYVHYKNSATAFNGVKKEEFEKKGVLNNTISALIFEHLEKNGVRTHFIRKVNDTDQICQKVTIIPLEVITRNLVAGSMAKKYGLEEGKKLSQPVFELSYKNDELGDPLINDDHAIALDIVTQEELAEIKQQTHRINTVLKDLFLQAGLVLVDFKIEFGKTHTGDIILADEISPDTCRLWEVNTGEKLDKDRFRRDLGSVMEAYEEVLGRLEHAKS